MLRALKNSFPTGVLDTVSTMASSPRQALEIAKRTIVFSVNRHGTLQFAKKSSNDSMIEFTTEQDGSVAKSFYIAIWMFTDGPNAIECNQVLSFASDFSYRSGPLGLILS